MPVILSSHPQVDSQYTSSFTKRSKIIPDSPPFWGSRAGRRGSPSLGCPGPPTGRSPCGARGCRSYSSARRSRPSPCLGALYTGSYVDLNITNRQTSDNNKPSILPHVIGIWHVFFTRSKFVKIGKGWSVFKRTSTHLHFERYLYPQALHQYPSKRIVMRTLMEFTD